ncbi:APC family permease [Helcobacillus massiliensis]|uniref:APC family permease n=1 Tax=Helcobacillus massiliensis TaxID=521392 RepID=UPI0025520E00|nr:APC family permease [Helcobacillus massiliensis]MDK7741624.1 APC family permease [Helcobacillus massiliensis]WOO92668.1 APC family permease [Helcobacillus massiliensis]
MSQATARQGGAGTGSHGSAPVGRASVGRDADGRRTHDDDTLGVPGAGRLGVASLVFLIIAASAPLTVLAGGVPTSFAVAGILGVPLGYVLLGAILALFAVGYGAMSAQIRNAGAFYAYIAAGLGVRQGIGASVLALVSYNLMQIGLYGITGFVVSSFLGAMVGAALPWWACALAVWALVGLLGINRIDLSAKIIAVLVVLEFIVVLLVDIVSFTVAPEGVSAAPISPDQLFIPGIGAVLSFGIAAFMGFESGAVYSEEVREPQRSVAKATFIAVSIIALFYAFSSWALAVGIGPSQIVPRSEELGPDLVFVFLGEQMPAVFTDIANVLFITSLLAALLAFHNAAARYFFSLGRTGVLPRFFENTSHRTGAPIAGSAAQSVLALIVILVFGVVGANAPEGPLFPVVTLFTWFCNAAAFGLVFLMAITSFAVIGFFVKRGRGEGVHTAADHDGAPRDTEALRGTAVPGVFTRLVAPLVAGIGLVVVFVLILINFDLLIGTGSPVLITVMPGIIIAAGIIGLIRGEYLKRVRPEVFRRAAVELDEPPVD